MGFRIPCASRLAAAREHQNQSFSELVLLLLADVISR